VTEEWIHRAFAPGKFSFLITLLESGEVIGFVGLRIPAKNPLPRIGYEISPSHWNKGYVTEALTAFISAYWEFYPDGLEGSKRDEEGGVVIDAGVEKSNAASLRVLEKVGFVCVAEEKVKDWYGGPDVVLERLRILKPEA
jgi:ribosomal-protein-alanine N-acetyltransferase